jgi:3',5'-cyclic AMP phosphodiesterase CpdA
VRTIISLSDLHFRAVPTMGLFNRSLIPLRRAAGSFPGDLTQRARTREFKAARRFLDALPQPQLVVPGNHDDALV